LQFASVSGWAFRLVIWGGNTFTVPVPETLQGATRCSGIYYPKNRLFVLVTGGLMAPRPAVEARAVG
jgi:hypothetical protein